VIRQQVRWAESRTYFYWRLRRRLRDFEVFNSIATTTAAGPTASRKKIMADLEALVPQNVWRDDKTMVQWFETHSEEVQRFINAKRFEVEAQVVREALERATVAVDEDAQEVAEAVAALKSSLKGLSAQSKDLLKQALAEL